jgi:Ca2+:H+ antiporter
MPPRNTNLTVFGIEPLYWLLPALPVAVVLRLLHADALWIFLAACLAIVPLAGLMGRATENLAETLGPSLGGLLNATFGNAAELIIGLMALRGGPAMYPLVKSSLIGSIIGNVLLVLGGSILAGGILYKKQTFSRTAASMGATLLALACVGLVIPSIYFALGASVAGQKGERVEMISEEIAIILAVTYVLSLVFTLGTHRDLFTGREEAGPRAEPVQAAGWGRITSLVVLSVATAGVALMSELLVGSVEAAATGMGMTKTFIGVIVVAIIGNAAEHSTAVLMAVKNRMDLAFTIAVGSSIQIALFVAPMLVFASALMGQAPVLDLHFSSMEVAAAVITIVVLTLVSQDGESHWMEGVMLVAVYGMLALAFYHLPA